MSPPQRDRRRRSRARGYSKHKGDGGVVRWRMYGMFKGHGTQVATQQGNRHRELGRILGALLLPPTFAFTCQKMPRASKMAERAARRKSMMLPNLPRARKQMSTPRRTCPHCSRTLNSLVGRDRHILLRPYCRSKHMLARGSEVSNQRQRKRKRRTDLSETDTDTDAGPSPSKQTRMDNGPPPNYVAPPNDSGSEGGRDPEGGAESIAGDERICGEPFVEQFPIDTAGAPISLETKPARDLRAYVDSCGRLRDPDLFETAELLVMTVPKAKDRTKHLRSKVVSDSQI